MIAEGLSGPVRYVAVKLKKMYCVVLFGATGDRSWMSKSEWLGGGHIAVTRKGV